MKIWLISGQYFDKSLYESSITCPNVFNQEQIIALLRLFKINNEKIFAHFYVARKN